VATQLGNALRDSAVVNLTEAVTMIVDESPFAQELTSSALAGFGIRSRYVCRSTEEAKAILAEQPVDLVLVNCEIPDIGGYGLVKWLRRSGMDANAFVPVIMTATHVRRSKVDLSRDCGANFVITKPFSAHTLLERIVWSARDIRPFLEVNDYFGPDRRFREAEFSGADRRVSGVRALPPAPRGGR
jgi:DNA-binding response OmpR family regulator